MTANKLDVLIVYGIIASTAAMWVFSYNKLEKRIKLWTFKDVLFLVFFTTFFPLGIYDVAIMWLEHWTKS